MRLLVLALVACRPTPERVPVEPDPTDDTAADTAADGGDDTAPVGPSQPALPIVADAEDIDPDDDIVHIALTAAPATHTVVDWRTGEERVVDGYAYNGQTPGPTLRAKVGDTVVIDLDNQLDVPTTIHWHGIDVPWDMDGVTWMQDPVGPGGSKTYTFTVPRAGTFWYHPHFDTVHQVDRGLYGVVVVEDPAEPGVSRDLVLVLDDWGEETGVAAYASDLHGAHGREGWWTVNGAVRPALAVDAGETLRLRLLNASNHGYLDLSMDASRTLARDQGLLPAVEEGLAEVLAPGDRVEVEVRPGDTALALRDAPYSLNGGAALGDPLVQLDLPVASPGAAAGPLDWPVEAAAPSPDPGRSDITWTFQGSLHTNDWLISGERFPDVTVPEVAVGDEVIIEVRNLSATEHPYHLHGMRFEVLSVGGAVPAQRRIEDTLNIPMHGAARLRLDADNPGDWMSHCHILPHADGGMMTVLRVRE
jgi:FtsP/CotA-like multicopper oxidase with cupredoxin domain